SVPKSNEGGVIHTSGKPKGVYAGRRGKVSHGKASGAARAGESLGCPPGAMQGRRWHGFQPGDGPRWSYRPVHLIKGSPVSPGVVIGRIFALDDEKQRIP